ncbi:MAG TPA: hypothetical protein VFW27_26645, partial [Actinoplanes sp.]|nr:hypothetical protein [Actinoplanes sp.]
MPLLAVAIVVLLAAGLIVLALRMRLRPSRRPTLRRLLTRPRPALSPPFALLTLRKHAAPLALLTVGKRLPLCSAYREEAEQRFPAPSSPAVAVVAAVATCGFLALIWPFGGA